MMRARIALAFLAGAVLVTSTTGCPSLDDPSGAPRVPDPPTSATTPRPTATATATAAPTTAPTAAPTARPVAEPTRDPRGSRCMECSTDADCRSPLRCFPFTDGRKRCDTVNPGPPC
jgi:hypothetical protein